MYGDDDYDYDDDDDKITTIISPRIWFATVFIKLKNEWMDGWMGWKTSNRKYIERTKFGYHQQCVGVI